MRVNRIQLEWFRGAAAYAALEPNGKSVVVYGQNGSGKSSFVDAFEYVIRPGRIDHLAHEYSGKRQEKAVPNTHKPPDQNASLSIDFDDGAEVAAEIDDNGYSQIIGAEPVGLDDWEYQRTILRQHEVSHFIHRRKGEKYSALLPLLGISPLEKAAENLRQLAKAIEEHAKSNQEATALHQLDVQRKETFGDATDEEIREELEGLQEKYCPEQGESTCLIARCSELSEVIDRHISNLNEGQRRHAFLNEASGVKLEDQIAGVRHANSKIANVTETLINEKLEVLVAADSYVANVEAGVEQVDCPACGRPIPVDDFQQHVESEKDRLRDIIEAFKGRNEWISALCRSVDSLQRLLGKAEMEPWRREKSKGDLRDAIAWLDALDLETLRKSFDEETLASLEANLLPIINAAFDSAKHEPPEAEELYSDRYKVERAPDVLKAATRRAALERAQTLAEYIRKLEEKVREEIGRQANRVIVDISKDVRQMWSVLHPETGIDNVHLSMPADKSIDIGLRFHGVEQESPRLTLSEGYRNALGLCIVLAMAKREGEQDRPLFLDDVVVSMDRPHRGMIANLLDQKFSARQVLLLTHDRDWYTELRQQFDSRKWLFNALLPYEDPSIGIRWAAGNNEFGDARAHLVDRPDSAGNDARKIMDVELAIAAENLRIMLPFLRGHRNDQRVAHEFAQRIAGAAKRCFQKKGESGYAIYEEAIDALLYADKLLVSWGNRSSHSKDLVQSEASALIYACENALAYFRCPDCGTPLWYAEASSQKLVQCQCSRIRWRYGKA